jgi:uncharacterized protein with HEPN domain
MSKKDKANLLAILDSIEKILTYIQDTTSATQFYENTILFDATLMNFVVIGEMVDRVSAELKAQEKDIDWQKIKAFRNLVAHDYIGVDAEEVWQIIHNHLPNMKTQIQAILAKLISEK